MTAKQDAGRALRVYREDVRAKIARAEGEIADLRQEAERIDAALTSIEEQPARTAAAAPASQQRAVPRRRRRAQRADRATRVAQISEALESGPLGVRELSQRIDLTPSRTRALAAELRGEGVLTSERQGRGATAPEVFSLPASKDGGSSGDTRTAQASRPRRRRPRTDAASSN